jgi:probable phosphoglycerate mutase
VQAIEDIAARHEKEMVVVVSHADIIRLLLAHYLGIHIDLFQRLIISPASASVLSLHPGGMVHVSRMNDDGPMHAPAPPGQAPKEREKVKKKSNKAATTPENGRKRQAPSNDQTAAASAPHLFDDGHEPAAERSPALSIGDEEE